MSDVSAPKRVRRTKAEQRAETHEQILDAAEYLFSKNGLHGVTLRDVAQRVGVHTTLLHYYFEDKKKLFEAVFARRAGVTVGRRMEALERYAAEAGDTPTVEGALHAFLDTDLDLYIEGGEPWMNWAAFCAGVSNTPEGAVLMDEHFDPVVLKLVDLLQRALPETPRQDIFWGYHFVTGALMNTLASADPTTSRRSRTAWPASWPPASWRSARRPRRRRRPPARPAQPAPNNFHPILN
jgi:AcrR family transcriptional regulator